MKVAIVHYWFTNWRGGERVVEELLRLYPQADVYCHVADHELLQRRLPGLRVQETFIARLPFARRLYRLYLPLMPKALEDLDLQAYDLIISSESGPAKGIIKRPDALHVCYCHSPMRYLWDMSYEYRRSLGHIKGRLLGWMAPRLRIWDVVSAIRVDQFIANSAFVAQRIAAYYGKPSLVIHPPVRVEGAIAAQDSSEAPYYLVAGELASYKRADLAVAAARRLGRRLVVVGDGEQRAALRAMAGDGVEFVGRVSDAEFRRWLAGARALLFPGLEDFGMVPVEAMALGTPLIAYARGGALEYLVEGVNGLGFIEQSCEALCAALLRFEAREQEFSREAVRATVLRFDAARFRNEFSALVRRLAVPAAQMTAVTSAGNKSVM
ncbi:MAG TPA: glycosyltransferase [Solimonas sp.]|nr:glycosyltransferase [Solimonas sp.]